YWPFRQRLLLLHTPPEGCLYDLMRTDPAARTGKGRLSGTNQLEIHRLVPPKYLGRMADKHKVGAVVRSGYRGLYGISSSKARIVALELRQHVGKGDGKWISSSLDEPGSGGLNHVDERSGIDSQPYQQ